MTTHLFQARYSAAAFKGMMTQPSDRQAAANAMLGAMGLKLISFYYVPGTSGIAGIIEGTSEQTAAAGMAICASGAFTSFESAEVLSSDQMNRAMKHAAEVAGQYQAPN